MKNITKFLTILVAALTIGSANSQSLFNAHEFGLTLGTGYVVDRSAAFKNDYSFNLSAGASYFFTKHFGIEASVPFYATSGPSFSEVQFGTLFRLPLSDTIPVLRNVAPYVGAAGVYNRVTESSFAYIGKAGVEVRFNQNWGAFVEGQYRNDDFQWSKGETSLQGGIRLVF